MKEVEKIQQLRKFIIEKEEIRTSNMFKNIVESIKDSWEELKSTCHTTSLPISKRKLIVLTVILCFIFSITANWVTQPNPEKTFSDKYMTFQYPQSWEVHTSDYHPGLVTLISNDAKIEVQILNNNKEYVEHQDQLIYSIFTDKGNDSIEGVPVHIYTNSYLSTGNQIIYYYFFKNGKYYEVRGENIYESQDLIERIVGSIK